MLCNKIVLLLHSLPALRAFLTSSGKLPCFSAASHRRGLEIATGPKIPMMRPAMPPSFALPLLTLCALVAPLTAMAQLPPEPTDQLPPPATRTIDFRRDIQPLFEASCVQCHARGKSKGGLSLETRADFVAGGESGVPAVAGQSAGSKLIELVSGLNPDQIMPQKGRRLTREQVGLVRAWIDQGMAWPEEITFFKPEPANLHPRAPELPPARPGLEHPMDRIVDAYFARHQLAWAEPIDDRAYARRVWLDTVGLLPPPAELAAFIADRSADKRARLVQRLLADNQRYAEHWLTFWNDLLRNDYRGTGYTDGGRKQITGWLYTALARNLPYDQFVAQLLNPGAEAEGFANGIIWRGVVNASMVPPMQAAQAVAQVFLGVNLKCASCHNSFINSYTLEDSYGLASVYATRPLEIAECDRPTGEIARVKFLYEDLGAIDVQADANRRRQQLVEIITGRKNGRLPRAMVNRLWQRFMGHGLVEPVDEMDQPAWSPELLDWLAEDLVAHGYDLKHTMTRILTSRAYQLRAVPLGETREDYVFRGPAVRRLSAEQFVDAIGSIAGLSHASTEGKLNRAAALAPAASSLPLQPKWIWGAAGAQAGAKPEVLIFRRNIVLPTAPTEAHVAICADDNYSIRINGKQVASSARRNSTLTDWLDATAHLQGGENLIEITASNMPPDEGRLASIKSDALPELDSPAGLILYARVRTGRETLDFVSDRSWTALAYPRPPNTASGLSVAPDLGTPIELGPATELGGVDLAPWRLGRHFIELAAATKDTLPVERAALVAANPLMVALGRPNREQVTTVRPGTATTLQALELTNGATLAKMLRSSAEKLAASNPDSPAALIEQLYHRSLSRPPTSAELGIASRLVDSPARIEGIEDLLWSIAMLPEFQLIR
jgi:mono/diheme cytochrome c family protein